MYVSETIPKADLTIKAIGNQWYWSYEYPDYGDIVSEIPSQMGDVEGLMQRARKSLDDAENELSSSGSDSIAELQQRLDEANEALGGGNPSLAIGLSDGVTRSLREEAPASQR